jgi:type IV secretion system protein VirB9
MVHASTHSRLPNLGNQVFDFNYSGNVNNIPQLLKQYDSKLLILPPLGQKKSVEVNLSLQQVNLNDINDAITSQTGNQVRLVYDATNDSIRLSFTTVTDVGSDAVSESLKWQHGVSPKPVLKADGVVRFPYGEYQPVITCQPLNLCDIELQAGEEIEGIVIADSARWNEGDQGIPVVYSGSGSSLTPHLVLKPSQAGLDTTLLVTTTRRTYSFKLKSANNGYVLRAGFYYPADMIQKFEHNKSTLRDMRIASGTISTNPDLKLPLINLSHANYNYSIDGSNYSWKPTQVFDDGTSVYIQMPVDISSRSLPGICIIPDSNSSDCEMVNFRYNDHFYIIDKLFNQAKLMNGFGNSVETITIKRNPKPGFWARLFGS